MVILWLRLHLRQNSTFPFSNMFKIYGAFVALLLFFNGATLAQTTVFANGEDGYLCYRIPAIVKAPNGNLLAFCEARKQSCADHGNVKIVLKRSRDNGATWSKLQIVAENDALQAGNPAPVYDLTDKKHKKGRLFLFYNTGTLASEQAVREGKAMREVWYKTSTNHGKTWSKPVNITRFVSRPNHPEIDSAYQFKEDWRCYANTPGHALQLTQGPYKGRLFIPANHSEGPPKAQARDYFAHGFYSDDHGQTWAITPSVPYPGSNESTAAGLANGGILMNIRNQSGDSKNRILAISNSAGAQWDTIYTEPQLPDPVCQGSMLHYTNPKGQRVLLFSNLNHASQRENLTLHISYDDGKTWPVHQVICPGSAAYSDLVIQQNHQIGILYEKDNYTKIVYERVVMSDE